MRCPIFQINTNLLISGRNINIFYIIISFWKKAGALPGKPFQNIHFLFYLSLFLTVGFVIFQINTHFLRNQLQNIFGKNTVSCSLILTKKFALSIAKGFRKIDLLPHFYLISQRMRCAIFQINTDLLNKLKINVTN